MLAFLFVTGLIFCAVGLYGLSNPVAAVGTPLGLLIDTTAGLNQMRASAGGVPLLIGLLQLSSLRWPTLAIPALWAVTVTLGGLILRRCLSLLVDGMPPTVNLVYMGLETFGFVQALYWLRVEARLDEAAAQ